MGLYRCGRSEKGPIFLYCLNRTKKKKCHAIDEPPLTATAGRRVLNRAEDGKWGREQEQREIYNFYNIRIVFLYLVPAYQVLFYIYSLKKNGGRSSLLVALATIFKKKLYKNDNLKLEVSIWGKNWSYNAQKKKKKRYWSSHSSLEPVGWRSNVLPPIEVPLLSNRFCYDTVVSIMPGREKKTRNKKKTRKN